MKKYIQKRTSSIYNYKDKDIVKIIHLQNLLKNVLFVVLHNNALSPLFLKK